MIQHRLIQHRLIQHSLTLVSVVFEAELPLLQLQARSVAANVPPELVDEIIVIDNCARGMPPDAVARLRENYGPLRDRMRVLRPKDIGPVPGAVGWRSQQVLKLCVAKLISSERYLVLDAKNHFVRTLRSDFVEAPDGRARVNVYGYQTHRLRPDLEHVLSYLGLDSSGQVECFTATVTPFVLDTGIVRAMIADIEQKAGRNFGQEFIARDLTEFFLYSGWIIAGGRSLHDVFDLHQVACPVVWPKAATLAGVETAITAATERQTPVFTVHRRALARLDPAAGGTLARFWVDRGLFGSLEQADQFITDFQQAYQREMRKQRLRELPHRLRSLPHRVKRRTLRKLRPA
jgi:Family of unknown function (DUF6492)